MPPRRFVRSGAQQRAMLLDVVLALALAAALIGLAAGLGVVAFIAVPVLVLALATFGAERLAGRVRRGRRGRPTREYG